MAVSVVDLQSFAPAEHVGRLCADCEGRLVVAHHGVYVAHYSI